MSRYIEENALINKLHQHFVDGFIEDKWWNSTHVMQAITHTPTADVVEVVRCKDCKHATMCEQVILYDDGTERVVNWCSRGERRENEQIHKYG